MELFPDDIMKKLIEQGRVSRSDPETDRGHKPLVKIFNPCGGATWLISEADPSTPNLLFGLCDLAMGFPEIGYVTRSELEEVRVPPFGLGLERDLYWEAKATLSEYADLARQNQAITEPVTVGG